MSDKLDESTETLSEVDSRLFTEAQFIAHSAIAELSATELFDVLRAGKHSKHFQFDEEDLKSTTVEPPLQQVLKKRIEE